MSAQRLGSDSAANWRNAVSEEFVTLIQHEAAASVIRNFEPILVPGLCQTPRYRQTLLQHLRPDDAEALDQLRMQRQEAVLDKNRPELHIVIDENVIVRRVGSADIMAEQVNHIRELARRPHITVSIMPKRRGLYPLMRTAYVHLETSTEGELLYIEEASGEKIITQTSGPGHGSLTPANYLSRFLEVEQAAQEEATDELLLQALVAHA